MIKKIAVIGTGVIGSGWIVRFLAHNKKVIAYDKDIRLKKKIIKEIKQTWTYVKKHFNKKKLKHKNYSIETSLKDALKDAEFVQECAPENYKLKIRLMKEIGKYSKSDAIIALGFAYLLILVINLVFKT